VKYEFPSGVVWCYNNWMLFLAPFGTSVTIDLDTRAGTITFEAAEINKTIVCEPLGMRTITKGVEEFTAF
jgi:hypothetical protein